MLAWLRNVLDNAKPGGDSSWNNQGVVIQAWTHAGTPIVRSSVGYFMPGVAASLNLNTPEDLRAALQKAGAQ